MSVNHNSELYQVIRGRYIKTTSQIGLAELPHCDFGYHVPFSYSRHKQQVQQPGTVFKEVLRIFETCVHMPDIARNRKIMYIDSDEVKKKVPTLSKFEVYQTQV